MIKIKIKTSSLRCLSLRFLLLAAAVFVIVIFLAEGTRGSSFQAAVIRGVARIAVAFTPKPKPTILLPVKFDKQDHALSCEVATLKMALAYRGITVDESELITKVGFDPTHRKTKNGELTWGDPQKAFVGNIDGKMLVTGYGVYWLPIGRVANNYREAIVFENWSEADLISELENGNPVIIWGYLGSGKPTSWKTEDRKEIRAVSYEHTFVAHGFSGDSREPTGYFVIDPIYGETFFARDTFLKKWDAFGRSGVVVY